ncbi:MAG: 5-(carboxyamino)imidazole ribonucleotide mutase [Candidatus Cloacimonetes bacterium 4572_65]|nr:MAG: 5-(carboxyamino)imidazole ribonucleotide mutase [Candidatus Cloacimonetes bacterium 4572_65]
MAKLVRVLIGSKSDQEQANKILEFLEKFDIEYDFYVSSAHRKPEQTMNLAKNAEADGIEVVIAGAGMAAHLPGVVASHTHLPVIGVPFQGATLSGEDALLAIVQMPTGIPVATVAINGGKNAAILAAQILALNHPTIKESLLKFREEQSK